MAKTKTAGVCGTGSGDAMCPGSTPGTLGINDQADPNVLAQAGDTPGPVGVKDAAAQLTACPPASHPDPKRRRLTPLEFEALYHQVYVPYLDSQSGLAGGTNIDVHCYRNHKLARRRSNLEEKEKLVALLKAETQNAAGRLIDVEESQKFAIAEAFFAKGSPEAYAITLKCALRYQQASVAGLQKYCDDTAKLGLDCSGFVNQYFIAIGRLTKAQDIDVYAKAALRRQTAEVQPLDLLIWLDYSHIALVNHRIGNPNQVVVVESAESKRGLTHSTYRLLKVDKDGVFDVHRGGLPQDTARVYIVAGPS